MNRLEFAAIHYQAIRDQIRAQETAIDEETLADTVEGLTDLHDIIAAIIRSALSDEALADGLRHRINEMQDRLARFEDRASIRRHIARDAMQKTEIKRITAPDFTISLRPGSPSLAIIDESAIPAAYWEPLEPRLDRQALLAELKMGNKISGVQLSEAEHVLSVRVR